MSILSSSFLETSLLPASVSSVDHQEAERDLFFFSVSTFTKGEQMVPVLNQLGVHCAVYGNHDFGENMEYIFCVNLMFFFQDFGLETLGELVSRTTFPWLMSNVVDRETGGQLADGLRSDRLRGEEGGHPRAG